MASGMTNSTARPLNPCTGWRKDVAGLRVHGECGYVALPAFGMIELDWEANTMALQIRGAKGQGVLQEVIVSLDTCMQVGSSSSSSSGG